MSHPSNDPREASGSPLDPALPDGVAASRTVGVDEVRAHYRDVLADPERLQALQHLGVMDATPPEVFRLLVDAVRRSFDVRIVRIHLLDDRRQWIQAGSDDSTFTSIPVEPSACQYAIRQDATLVIADLSADTGFQEAVIGGQTMRFYAGTPLVTSDGQALGVLCLLDSEAGRGLPDAQVALLETLARVIAQTMELQESGARLRHELLRTLDEDLVTGLLDRRSLRVRLERLLERGEPFTRVVGVLAVHIRRIDRITHAHGRAAVNQLRYDIGERLRHSLGAEEILGHADDRTFVVLSPVNGNAGPDADGWLEVRASDLLGLLRAEPFEVGNDHLQPEVGVGVVNAPRDSDHADDLMVMADEAAAAAARQRLDRIGHPDHEAIAAKRRMLSLEGSLRRALADGDFCVHYQPIIDLTADAVVVGAEALLRWPQPEGQEPVGPDVFIPLAEELDIIDPIGRYVFQASCQQLRRWQALPGCGGFWLSVNLSPAQLQDPKLASYFVELARDAGVAPADVKLEITEGSLGGSVEVVHRVIDELADSGFPLALDDFGTGHSSLSRLINMPFEVLKVDRSFVWQSPDGAGAAVVSSLSQLARSLKLASLGEGVETPEHEAFLRRCGYTYAQGFLYGKPVPPSEFPMPVSTLES